MMLYERLKLSTSIPLEPRKKFLRDHLEEARAQPLVDLLPVSVQRFHMTSRKVGKGPSRKDVGAMFKGLPERRKERLPNLKEICVECTDDGDAVVKEGRPELRLRCKEADVAVASIKWTKGPYGGTS